MRKRMLFPYLNYSKQLLLSIFFMLSTVHLAYAQGNSVSGTVTDASGQSIPGVNVLIKGSSIGTTTNIDGKYTIKIPSSESILVFSFIGYIESETVAGQRTVIDVKLEEEVNKLKEVVVVGYGTQKKGEVTSSVASLKTEDFNKGAVSSPLQLIEGRVAGLTISRISSDPNSNPTIQMRGVSSIRGSNEPLIIIDGVPSNMSSLSAIAPEDVGSIDVLRDGSAAAIYGTRGNNGVIIVSTKRPSRGSAQVDYAGYVAHEIVAKRPSILTGDEFSAYGKRTNNANIKDFGGRDDAYDLLLNTSNLTHSHNLSATGGTGKLNYRASVNYKKAEGMVINSNRETMNMSIAANHKSFDDKLTLSFNLANSFIKAKQFPDDGAFYEATRRNPTIPIYNKDGSFYEDYNGYDDYNPIARANQRSKTADIKNTIGSFKANYEIIPGLSTAAFIAVEKSDSIRNEYNQINEFTSIKDGNKGRAWKRDQFTSNTIFEWTANYVKDFNGHNVNALLGYGYQDFDNRWSEMENKGFLADFGTDNMEAGTYLKDGRAVMKSKKITSKLISAFTRLNYNYQGRYMLSASIRREGSSKFGADNKWAIFPAFSGGWMMSNETFMKELVWVNSLKLRAGYGVTGSLPGDSYMSILRYAPGAGYWDANNNQWIPTYGPGNNQNKALKWERNISVNVGLDFSLLNNKLSGTIDWYQRETKDLIDNARVQQPAYIYSRMISNIGSIQNKGIELGLSSELVKSNDFSYNANLTFSYETNKLTNLSTPYEDRYSLPSPGNIGTAQRLQIDKNIGSFYGYKYKGYDKNGDWIFADLDGKPELSDNDKTFLGTGMPKFKASLMNNFIYKNFDLGVYLRGMFDYKVLNEGRIYFGSLSSINKSGTNVYDYALDSKITADPRFSDYYLENGSFVRVENITLGYTFKLNNTKHFRNIRCYANVNNVLTISGYKGLNPDVSVTGLEPGIEKRGAYPLTRTFMFGLNIGF